MATRTNRPPKPNKKRLEAARARLHALITDMWRVPDGTELTLHWGDNEIWNAFTLHEIATFTPGGGGGGDALQRYTFAVWEQPGTNPNDVAAWEQPGTNPNDVAAFLFACEEYVRYAYCLDKDDGYGDLDDPESDRVCLLSTIEKRLRKLDKKWSKK